MRVPILNLPVVYHIGTLDAAQRGEQWRQSHEGAGLSVSLCPEAWEGIAKLGGKPWHQCVRHDALYLDLHAMDDRLLMDMQVWAREAGLIEARGMWKAWYWDDEGDSWSYLLVDSQEKAIDELRAISEDDEDPGDLLSRMQDDKRIPPQPPTGSRIEETVVYVLTEAGRERAAGYNQQTDATDIAAMFWTEDVLRPLMPEVVGVWWQETYDPDLLSAPRGAILPSCLDRISFTETDRRYVDADEYLLEIMPSPRLIAPRDFQTAYTYVTNCVESTAELIGPMVDAGYSTGEFDYPDFVSMLGDGNPQNGEALLHQVFPDYEGSGLAMADDPYVSYYASAFDGIPCLYVVHSSIEYVFQREGLRKAPLAAKGLVPEEERPELPMP